MEPSASASVGSPAALTRKERVQRFIDDYAAEHGLQPCAHSNETPIWDMVAQVMAPIIEAIGFKWTALVSDNIVDYGDRGRGRGGVETGAVAADVFDGRMQELAAMLGISRASLSPKLSYTLDKAGVDAIIALTHKFKETQMLEGEETQRLQEALSRAHGEAEQAILGLKPAEALHFRSQETKEERVVVQRMYKQYLQLDACNELPEEAEDELFRDVVDPLQERRNMAVDAAQETKDASAEQLEYLLPGKTSKFFRGISYAMRKQQRRRCQRMYEQAVAAEPDGLGVPDECRTWAVKLCEDVQERKRLRAEAKAETIGASARLLQKLLPDKLLERCAALAYHMDSDQRTLLEGYDAAGERAKAETLWGELEKKEQASADSQSTTRQLQCKQSSVQCESCEKWRKVTHEYADYAAQLTGEWRCSMNPDLLHNTCAAPEELFEAVTTYGCKFPDCIKVYQDVHNLRKHCRNKHKIWYDGLSRGPSHFCVLITANEPMPPPVAAEAEEKVAADEKRKRSAPRPKKPPARGKKARGQENVPSQMHVRI